MRPFAVILALSPSLAFADGPIAEAEKQRVYSCEVDGTTYYTTRLEDFPEGECKHLFTAVEKPNGATILTACRDQPRPQEPGVIYGPSRRARECTRQLCETPEAQEAIRRFALSIPQSDAAQRVGDICTARKEADGRS
jgi:hypothetical protein